MNKKTTVIAEEGKQELFIYREFEAPSHLIFRAFSDPEILRQWMGPKEMDTIIHKLDNRSHGSWRFSHIDPDGNSHDFNGVIHEVMEPERIIRTFEYEGIPERGHVSLEFLTLENLENDRCKISIQVIFKSVQDRDAQIQSGMERGVVDSYERLDDILKNELI